MTYFIGSASDTIVEGLYILIQGKGDQVLIQDTSRAPPPFWVKNSRVASALETAEGRFTAGDRDDLQTRLDKAALEKNEMQGKEAKASQHIGELQATIDLADKQHRSKVYICCFILICVYCDTSKLANIPKVLKTQRRHNAAQKGASAALESSEAQLSVATAAIGYAYKAGGGADSELQECRRINETFRVGAAAAAREVSDIFFPYL